MASILQPAGVVVDAPAGPAAQLPPACPVTGGLLAPVEVVLTALGPDAQGRGGLLPADPVVRSMDAVMSECLAFQGLINTVHGRLRVVGISGSAGSPISAPDLFIMLALHENHSGRVQGRCTALCLGVP